MKNNDVSILNGAFVGGYGKSGENLPHEMINFFREDNNNFYVYITPSGVLKSEIKRNDIKGVLFIRSAGNSMVEVLAKAEFDEDSEYYTEGIVLRNKQILDGEKKKNYTEKIENAQIKYGNALIQEIHKENKLDNDIFVTLKASKICLPKKTFYLTYKESKVAKDIFYVGNKKINNQSMLAYYYESENDGFKTLKEIINAEEYWKDSSETPKFDVSKVENNDSFFKAIRKQDDEVIFSNMFYYFFSKYPSFLKVFSKCVLGKDIKSDSIVEREKDRMDIRIIDDSNFIIIENKLKSQINGMSEYKEGKDKKLFENKNKFKAKNGKYISQLSNYYEMAEVFLQEKGRDKNQIKPFIFIPNYSLIGKDYLKDYWFGEKYEPVYCSTIYQFFYRNKDDITKDFDCRDKFYFEDFMTAIKKHTTLVDDEYRIELMQRLKKRIEEI